jgi:hypothetical protein
MEVSSHLHAPAALPVGIGPGTHCIGGWVGPVARLDVIEKRKICSYGYPDSSIVPPVV